MALDFFELVSSLDQNEDIHLARILVLLESFQRADEPAIVGITKLAKLDFLLRYPSCFERAMIARKVSPRNLRIAEFEHATIETSMVRYRFGPWDHRYRKFLNILAARGLITLTVEGRTVVIDLTTKGAELAHILSQSEEFEDVKFRAGLLRKHLDLGATRLMEFIYEQFPELNNMQLNTEIELRTLA
ncbi:MULTISPECIES: hypothetical protein [unclassified Phaeobacter]|uniref:hypothetical protein n=1 Tax=unclassified Phaeobacter TaxID=2621772 RepID=UPI003A89E0F7